MLITPVPGNSKHYRARTAAISDILTLACLTPEMAFRIREVRFLSKLNFSL